MLENMTIVGFFIFFLIPLSVCQQHADTPPRGWNSYDSYSWVISEQEFLHNANLVAQRLLPFGYEYVVVDFLWFRKMEPGASVTSAGFDIVDEWGRPIPDPARWPSSRDGQGLKPIADQVHAMGLKFGIHVMRGISTQAVKDNTPVLGNLNQTWRARDIALQDEACSWMPHCFVHVNESSEGGQAFIQSLYNLYASWEVDFVKHDCVFGLDDFSLEEITTVSQAIATTGRPMLYSISPGVQANPRMATLINSFVNMYRVTGDDWDSWHDLQSHFDVARDFAAADLIGAPGLLGFSWPDLDMLPMGFLTDPGAAHGPNRWSRLSLQEKRTQMTLWAMARSPLMFGGDMISVDDTTFDILTNKIALEINANSYGNMEVQILDAIQEYTPMKELVNNTTMLFAVVDELNHNRSIAELRQRFHTRIWMARGIGGEYYVALFNLEKWSIDVSLPLIGIVEEGLQIRRVTNDTMDYQCQGKEAWSNRDIRTMNGRLHATLAPHGCALFSLHCYLS